LKTVMQRYSDPKVILVSFHAESSDDVRLVLEEKEERMR
jgi:hypothetical protein